MRHEYRTRHVRRIALLAIALVALPAGRARADEDSKYLDAVREFADNVLKYGRDTYGPKHTPLFVDGLNIHTHEPVKWISPKGNVFKATETEEWILSNFASQQTLLRTLDGLSEVTGDLQYRNAAKEAIAYAFDNLRSPNGLLCWGHWVAYDAKADQVRYAGGRVHILKVHYPYYELMWQVDPDATRKFIEAFWSGHVLDWSNLDFDRMASLEGPLEEPWNHEYTGGPTFFKSKLSGGYGFFHTGTSLTYAGTMLYRLSGQEQSLLWSKRLIRRFVDTRHPKTGISVHTYNQPQRPLGDVLMGDVLKESFSDPRTFVFPFDPFTEMRNMYHPENVQPHWWLSLLLVGDMLGERGTEFSQWALEELTAWGKASYRKADNSFVPILTDGTNIEGYVSLEDCSRGPKGSIARPLFADLGFFWAYATAHRTTNDAFMWQMARDIGIGNGLGDIGEGPTGAAKLRTDVRCSDVYALLGFMELHRKTNNPAFLQMAQRIGDNILSEQFYKGFFVPSKKHIYTRFDCFEPLALLHLHAAIKAKTGSVPQVWPSSPLFVPPYRYKQEGEDRRIIYTLTESADVPMSLQEAAAIGDVNLVSSRIDRGTGIDSMDDSYKLTALQRAAISGHTNVARLLIAKGARVNRGPTTPLCFAVQYGHKDMVEFLLYNGADVNARDNNEQTPLSLAKEAGQKEIAELLRQHGAKE